MNVSGKLSSLVVSLALTLLLVAPAQSVPVPGGTLDPLTIPKYVQPLVIPPPMPVSADVNVPAANYNIAVRQFKQQILPGGVWNTVNGRTDAFGATTVWSYGRAEDTIPGVPGTFVAPAPVASGVSFNYPAFTIEATSNVPTTVRWINDLVTDPVACAASPDKTIPACLFLPHLFPVDQSLHWANPPKANCTTGLPNRTDCVTAVAAPYTGPVPLVTHVHGAHVQPHSDGYPDAWWLPGAPGTKGIPLTYGERGTDYTQANNANTVPGSAYYGYQNDQPATTLWYHDHAMGMTRLNVIAGPAGFWLVRGGVNDTAAGVLPGPAPTAGGDPNFVAAYRSTIREIPVAIQDRSFNLDGSLFYPANRTFFDGFTGPFIGGTGTPVGPSDISGIWNPEAFFNTIVVNGTTWPKLDVTPTRYRLRLLDGCNSRTLNLALKTVTSLGPDLIAGTADDVLGAEIPFYQIGAEQGFLPKVVQITTGFATPLPGNGTIPAPVPAANPLHALLMGPAERADVIVDFTGLAAGTRIRMINTAPDSPFQGFGPLVVPADSLTSGQVMDFVVNASAPLASDLLTTAPASLILPAEAAMAAVVTNTRQLSLNEMSSDQVCVEVNPVTGAIVGTLFSTTPLDPLFLANCAAALPVTLGNLPQPMGPRQALLGTVVPGLTAGTLTAVPKMFADPITENPLLGSTEIWEIYNTTKDAHPIHLHLVRYQVVNRQTLDPVALLAGNLKPLVGSLLQSPRPNEMGYKDTVVAYPGEVTRIKSTFNIAGLYVWHCHIVEHEDNEMMRPFVVKLPATGATLTPGVLSPQVPGTSVSFLAAATGGDAGPYEYRFWYRSNVVASPWVLGQAYSASATWIWNTATPALLPVGAYTIMVETRHVGNPAKKEAAKTLAYNLLPAFTAATSVTLTPSVLSPQIPGTSVSFLGAAVGGDVGPYTYQFWYRSNVVGSPWVLGQAYSASATWIWNTATLALPAGAYTVMVETRHTVNPAKNEASKSVAFNLVPAFTAPTSVTLTPSALSPQLPGTSVSFLGAAVGGDVGPYEYRFWYRSNVVGSPWVLGQAYSASATWIWNTATLALPAGAYTVMVETRHTVNPAKNEAAKSVAFNLVPAFTAATSVTLTPSLTSPRLAGTSISFLGAAVGGDVGPYEYRFWYRSNVVGSPWVVGQAYSPSATWIWNTATPALPIGAYTIMVETRHTVNPAKNEAAKSVPFALN